ncbi:hypothetical protein V8C34DRAFT_314657 [Trichoderma compactum]
MVPGVLGTESARRRQFSSCDYCRKSRIACDASHLQRHQQTNSGSPDASSSSSRVQCTNCSKRALPCTYEAKIQHDEAGPTATVEADDHSHLFLLSGPARIVAPMWCLIILTMLQLAVSLDWANCTCSTDGHVPHRHGCPRGDRAVQLALISSVHAFSFRWLPLVSDTATDGQQLLLLGDHLWNNAKSRIMAVFDKLSYQTALALYLFGLTPISKGASVDVENAHSAGEVSIDMALRQIHRLRVKRRDLRFSGTGLSVGRSDGENHISHNSVNEDFIHAENMMYWAGVVFDTSSSMTRGCPSILCSGVFGFEEEPVFRLMKARVQLFHESTESWRQNGFVPTSHATLYIVHRASTWKGYTWKIIGALREAINHGYGEAVITRLQTLIAEALDRFDKTFKPLLAACEKHILFFSKDARLCYYLLQMHYYMGLLLLCSLAVSMERTDMVPMFDAVRRDSVHVIFSTISFGLSCKVPLSQDGTQHTRKLSSLISLDPYPHHILASLQLATHVLLIYLKRDEITQDAFDNFCRIVFDALDKLPQCLQYLQPGNGAGGVYNQYDDNRRGSSSQLSSHSQSSTGGRQRKGLVSGLVRGVAAGIGLASESYHNHQEKTKAKASAAATSGESSTAGESSRAVYNDEAHPESSSRGFPDEKRHGSNEHDDDDSSDSEENSGPIHVDQKTSRDLEEAQWELDAAQQQLEPPPDYATVMEQDLDVQAMADGFVRSHALPSSQQVQQHGLPMPVILPQRRPGERARGFIHAYAPLLQNVGIDQATFIDFIKQLNMATAPSPWINAINVAAIAVQHVPEPITIAVSIAAQITTQVSLQAHSRSKTNTFLNKMNAEFFRPLGLIAIIMTWKPSRVGEVVTQVTFDAALEQATQNASGPRPGMGAGIGNKMQASHGTTNFEWPESAPLVFPTLDKLADSVEGRQAVEEAGKKQPNGMMRSMIFAMEYMDKRSQAQWANRHPESRLAQLNVKPKFHSRYADPNHPASSGSLLALLTGGAVGGSVSDRKQSRRDRKAARRGRRSERKEQRGPTILNTVGPGALIRGIRKIMHELRKWQQHSNSYKYTLYKADSQRHMAYS